MGLVLDCSAFLALFIEEEKPAISRAILEAISDNQIVVPPLWIYELSNSLKVVVQRGRLSKDDAEGVFGSLLDIRLQVDPKITVSMAKDIYHLADMYDLTAYDAAYLELCLRRKLPLATLDQQLIKAARKADVRLLE